MSEYPSCALPTMTVRELCADVLSHPLDLVVVAGAEGLDTRIHRPRIQKPGLALAGFLEYVHPGRIQILGRSEFNFLEERAPGERARIVSQLCRQGISCLLLTNGHVPQPEMLAEAESQRVPLLSTARPTSEVIDVLTRLLAERLAPRTVQHGVLMDVYGVGVFVLGDSGIGKSECALELVSRGHRLVSDDVVEIKRVGDQLIGTGPELTRYHMELRGLGIINVKDLFGVAAVRQTKFVDQVIRLDPWKPGKSYDLLGLDDQRCEILGMELPYLELPVGPGRNLTVLIEVAARNHLLKRQGFHPARELARRVGGERSEPDGSGESGVLTPESRSESDDGGA